MYTSLPKSQINQQPKAIGDAYLKVQLDQETSAVLEMKYTQKVLVVPVERVTPMPNMPPCVLGLVSQRSRVMWAVNLAQMLGLQPLNINHEFYNLVIIRVEQNPLALIVQEVKGVSRFTRDLIQKPLKSFDSGITPYLHGCILKPPELLLLLDAEAIIHSGMWQHN